MNGNRNFLIVFGACFALIVLFGVASFLLAIATDHDESTSKLMITTFRGMFTGLLGLGSGFVIGRATGNGNSKKETADG